MHGTLGGMTMMHCEESTHLRPDSGAVPPAAMALSRCSNSLRERSALPWRLSCARRRLRSSLMGQGQGKGEGCQ